MKSLKIVWRKKNTPSTNNPAFSSKQSEQQNTPEKKFDLLRVFKKCFFESENFIPIGKEKIKNTFHLFEQFCDDVLEKVFHSFAQVFWFDILRTKIVLKVCIYPEKERFSLNTFKKLSIKNSQTYKQHRHLNKFTLF